MTLLLRSKKTLAVLVVLVLFSLVGCDGGVSNGAKTVEGKPDISLDGEALNGDRERLNSKHQDDLSDVDGKEVRVLLYESQITTRKTIQDLRAAGASIATVSVPWADVEPKEGVFHYDKFYEFFDQLVAEGFRLNIILDAGGRLFYEDGRNKLSDDGEVIGSTVIPNWAFAKNNFPVGTSFDFYGSPSSEPSFFDRGMKNEISLFFSRAVKHYSGKYGRSIYGFTIGVQSEHEIKYGQHGYRWRGFEKSAQIQFKEKYGDRMPVFDYAHSIGGITRFNPLRSALSDFRRFNLASSICDLADVVRQAGGRPIGYFGEFFNSHDAIYGLDVIDLLPGCLSMVVVDFNYFDGWERNPNPLVLPMLVNYTKSLGYKHVSAGLYFERWRLDTGEDVGLLPEVVTFADLTIDGLRLRDDFDGIELGGFGRLEPEAVSLTQKLYPKLTSLVLKQDPVISANNTAVTGDQKRRVAILASRNTFNLWHGERAGGRNIHHEALVRMFELLSLNPNVLINVIGETHLKTPSPLEVYDALVIPHQASLSQIERQAIKAFRDNGGVVIQDIRAGEYLPSGISTGTWMGEIFGIESISWISKGNFVRDDKLFSFSDTAPLGSSPTLALLTPADGYEALLTWQDDPTRGLFVRGKNTIVLGFMPQLMDGPEGEVLREFFLEQLDLQLRLRSPL